MYNQAANSQFVFVLFAALVGATSCSADPCIRADERSPELAVRRAISFLSRQVPAWTKEHRCYSCHNNGDGARALLAARQLKFAVADESLADSITWLKSSARWDTNGPDGEFSDRKLARVQFAAALGAAVEAGFVDRVALQQAAADLAAEQVSDGSWEFTGADELGSPVTYGRTLATALARHSLVVADAERHRLAIGKADRWLRTRHLKSVIDTSATLIGLADATDDQAATLRRQGVEFLRRGQSEDGGWGPFVASPPESFDTALALIALGRVTDSSVEGMRQRGRQFLMTAQLSDGSWPETTRPVPRESYAQRISTTAWATLALLERR